MAVAKFKLTPKRGPLGFVTKVSIAIVLGLSFAVIWSTFSPNSSEAEVSSKRNSFEGEILEPESKIPPAKAKGQGKETNKETHASLGKNSSNATATATVEVSNPEGETLKGNETVVEVKEEQREEETREEQGEGENNQEQAGIQPLIPFFLFYLVTYC